MMLIFFFFNDTATTEIYTLSLHDALPIYHSIVASPDGQTFVSTAGNAGLAKGGTGDVLTGILAALIAQFGADDGARVLSLGVYLHGLAAELASRGTDLSALPPSEIHNG